MRFNQRTFNGGTSFENRKGKRKRRTKCEIHNKIFLNVQVGKAKFWFQEEIVGQLGR